MTSTPPDAPAPIPPTWEQRFRVPRVGLPRWARDAPERTVVVATAAGVTEVHAWQLPDGGLRQVTDRPKGTAHATVDPSGAWVWWFDDTDGDEFGVWRRQRYDAPAGTPADDATGLPAAYPAGLALLRDGSAVVGSADDDGSRIHLVAPNGAAEPVELYASAESADVSAVSEDGTLLAISHSEHGDSRHPALRVLRLDPGARGERVAELWDGPERGVEALGFAPLPGDPRLLVQHERRGRGELLVWDVESGEQSELDLSALLDAAPGGAQQLPPGEVADAEWTRDGASLLVTVDRAARTTLHRVELAGGAVSGTSPVGPEDGTVRASTARPDGAVWLSWSSAAEPLSVLEVAPDGSSRVLVRPQGPVAAPSAPVEDVWVDGPGGRVHALLRRPAGPAPHPVVVEVHGGPTSHETDAFSPYPAAWIDAGYAVLSVNYRGSTGYGSVWRDALTESVGATELADVAAVRDALVERGDIDPQRCVLAGASWGGFLTLLGLGTQPERWSLGIAGVPVADYVAAYEDEMEPLKAFDRSLFGGTPDEVPEKYAAASPLTHVDRVRVPVLVLAGENDPRCPIRQIDNYLAALRERGGDVEEYRFDAGHGSYVDDERVRQMAAELDFARRHLG